MVYIHMAYAKYFHYPTLFNPAADISAWLIPPPKQAFSPQFKEVGPVILSLVQGRPARRRSVMHYEDD